MVRSKLHISDLIDSKVNLFLLLNWRIWFGNEKFHVWTGSDKKKSSGRRFYCSQCFGIERYTFHLRAMQIETKENFNLRKKSTPTGLVCQTSMAAVLSCWQINMADWRHANCCFMIHKSLTTTVVQKVRLSKSTLSPDEDLQCAVETSWSISKWQSWNKR